MAENLSNDFATTLSGAITNSATAITVTSGAGAPSPNFRVRVDSELMLVTSVGAGTNWTVTRGIEGTSAVAHADLAAVAHVITKAGLDQYLSENYATLAHNHDASYAPLSHTHAAADLPTAWTVVRKTADETVSASTTLQDDDTLQLAVSANTKYRIKIYAWVTTSAGAFKWRITGPTSPTRVAIATHWQSNNSTHDDTTNGNVDSAFHTGDQTGPVGGWTNDALFEFDILLHNGANSGTVKLTWAQISASGSTIIRAGSTLEHMSF